MVFRHSVPLRFSDTDLMGHVNNARYSTYLEESRVALREKLKAGVGFDPGWILANIEIAFTNELTLSAEPVEIETWVERIGDKSFTMGSEITHGGTVVARARSVMSGFDYSKRTPRSLSEAERTALGAYKMEPRALRQPKPERGDLTR